MDVDILVIGAGPAGSAASAWLAQRGHRVLCLERGYFPRHVIGESLLPRCNDLLREAGLWDAVVARKYMQKPGAAFLRQDQVTRFTFAEGLGGDSPWTFQVPRHDFDKTLATAARSHGADIRFGHGVLDVQPTDQGHAVTFSHEEVGRRETVEARFVLDCSGTGRVLARLWNLDAPAPLPSRTALFTMVEGDRRPRENEGEIWVCEAEVGWIWIIPFSDGRTSVGIVGDDDTLQALAENDHERLWQALRSEPNARDRLAAAQPVLPTFRRQGWTTKVTRSHGPGWALAGNAGDFLDPVFSSGVCMALESALMAARLVDRQLQGEQVDWQQTFEQELAGAVDVFRAFVEAWYAGSLQRIFFSSGRNENIQRSITSVLGGYVFNRQNSLVRAPRQALETLLHTVSAAPAS